MDKLYAIKIRQSDGTYGAAIPVSVLAENVDWNSTLSLVDILGQVDTSESIQDQINNLKNTKATQASVNALDQKVDNAIEYITHNGEITNAREGADGTEYSTLKERLDSEYNVLYSQSAGNPINVLSLGVKNDGSEDCTEIVNDALINNSLYFPIGHYKFDGTIVANNSIYGAGYTEEYKDDLNAANLFFTNDSSNNIEIPYTYDRSLTLKNFNIVRNWSATSDAIHHTTNRRTIIKNIGIFNSKSGHAIYVRHGTSISRNVHIYDVVVIGDFDKGIYFHGSPDSVINSCSLMRCKIGVELNYSGFTQLNNIHVWPVPRNDTNKTDEYWQATRGFIFRNNSDCTCDGLYADTCYIDIACLSSRVTIGSLRTWVDKASISNFATNLNGQLAYIDADSDLYIDNYIGMVSDLKQGGLGTRNGLVIKKPIVFSDENYIGRNSSYPVPDTAMYYVPQASNNYQAVAVLRHRYGGSCKLTIQCDINQVEIIENPADNYSKTVTRGTGFAVYRKTVTGGDGWNNMVFFVPKGDYTVKIENFQRVNYYGLIDYSGIYDSNRTKIVLPSQANTTGLVEIT